MSQYRSNSKGPKDKEPGLELSIGQVLAAAGATVVGAILAKLLGLWGTVAGTAILSVCSSIGAVLILRAMRSTGNRIKSQIAAMAPTAAGKATAVTIELHPDSVTATAKIPETEQLHSTQGDTVEMVVPDLEPEGHVTDAHSRKKTLLTILVSSVIVFCLTIATLFLIGLFTGDSGRFIHDSGDTTTTIIQSPEGEGADETETVTETETDAEPTDETSEQPTDDGTDPEPSTSPSADPTPSEAPTSEGGQGGTEPTPSQTPGAEELSSSESTTE